MERNLKLWIAQSESWHTFIDFKLPEEDIAQYPFLKRKDDFYVALFCKLFDLLNDSEIENKKDELLALGKGLEIYSLKNTRNEFEGVNYYENILYAGSLYYLADYSASAWILANLFNLDNYATDIDKFISSFLRRDLSILNTNAYVAQFNNYLTYGDITVLKELKEYFLQKTKESLPNSPYEYTSFKLASTLIEKFYKNNIWVDLLSQDHNTQEIWKKYVEINLKRKPPVWDFFPSQKEALNRGILKENKTFSFQMPTSAGKTALCELIIYKEKVKNPASKILFLAPFRALASELKFGFTRKLAQLEIVSKTIYGGNITTQNEKDSIQRIDLLISTPEKFMAIEGAIPNVYEMFQTIICDEGHLLDNEQRGLSYELLLSKFKSTTIDERKFIFLSAIIPNIDDINSWLGGDENTLITSNYRPTELNFAFLKQRGKTFFLDVNPTKERPENYQIYKFITKKDFQYINRRTKRRNTYAFNTNKAISVAVSLKSVTFGTVALFTPQKGDNGVTGLAKELIKQLDLLSFPNPFSFSNEETINSLKEYFDKLFGENYLLTKLIVYGTVFHHGDLPQDVREVIEDALRKGDIKLAICTNTLAEGVNLPIKTIVIHSTKRYDYQSERLEPIEVRDLKNIIGRAGRAGCETKGLVIVPNESDFNMVEKVIRDEGNRNVTGYLYKIIKEIDKYVKEKRLTLSNDLFEQQAEWFKQLIDSIDISIIDLLAEEVEIEKLEEHINSLVEKTFAFQQSTDTEKETLNKIFNLRGDTLKPYIETEEFEIIKNSGSSIRLYKDILSSLNLEDDFWTTADDPLSNEWLTFIKNTVLELPQLKSRIEEFNKSNNLNLIPENIMQVIELWISGNLYKQISIKTEQTVDSILKLFSSIIGFHIQSIISNIIRIIDLKLVEENKSLSQAILYWPQHLLYGLKNRLQLDLIELGFTNRICIMALSDIIQETGFSYSELKQLRAYINRNGSKLIEKIKPQIPFVSYNKLLDDMGYLKQRNIL